MSRRRATWLKFLRTRTTSLAADHERAARALIAATADAAALGRVLHPDVCVTVDAGGQVPAPDAPLRGRSDVGRYLLAVLGGDDVDAVVESVNGMPGIVLRRDDVVVGVLVLEVRASRVCEAWLVTNPDKLASWNRR